MNTRRHFLQMMGYSSAALYSSQFLMGCAEEAAAKAGGSIDWMSSSSPPVLNGDPTRPWWVRGNYGPVADEMEAFDLPVLGAIPPELNGVFLRNGPNPKGDTVSDHWFFGDGMLHGLKLENGKAVWYRNRWIQTDAYLNDTPGLLGNRGNTALVHHAGKTYGLFEGGLPYEVNPTDLSTVGLHSYNNQIVGPMSAHPKIDPITGEMHTFGYSPFPPYLRYHVIDSSGTVTHSEAITVPKPSMMHDFQLTETHVVFYDLPLVFDLTLMATNPFPIRWDPDNGARIGVLPRGGTDADITWFDIDICYMFHTFNAYNDAQGRVVLEGCRYPSLWEYDPTDLGGKGTPWRWTLDPTNGAVTEGAFEDFRADFPVIDRRMQGREHRINYALKQALGVDGYPTHPVGVLKHDRVAGSVDVWSPGEAVQPDEPLFVPASDSAGEDEGWLLSMVYDHAEDRSEVVILDATDVAAGPIARIPMPRRVPFGFHGIWVPSV